MRRYSAKELYFSTIIRNKVHDHSRSCAVAEFADRQIPDKSMEQGDSISKSRSLNLFLGEIQHRLRRVYARKRQPGLVLPSSRISAPVPAPTINISHSGFK